MRLVPLPVSDAERVRSRSDIHYAHRYPGALTPHIVRFLLGASSPLRDLQGHTVLDPFCGAGAIPVEAISRGIQATSWDSNPLACLATRVKTRSATKARIGEIAAEIGKNAGRLGQVDPPPVVNIDYWYSERNRDQLASLAASISTLRSGPTRDLMRLALSRTAIELSQCNPRYPVPVLLCPDKYSSRNPIRKQLENRLAWLESVNTIDHFTEVAADIAGRIERFRKAAPKVLGLSRVSQHDARQSPVGALEAKAVITSPPYPGAQKYTRFSSLSLGWLGYAGPADLRSLKNQQIGREHFPTEEVEKPLSRTGVPEADALLQEVATLNRARALVGATYLADMRSAIKVMRGQLSAGGALVLITAPSLFVAGSFQRLSSFAGSALRKDSRSKCGFKDPIRSRRLSTARNGSAEPMPYEAIDVYRKA